MFRLRPAHAGAAVRRWTLIRYNRAVPRRVMVGRVLRLIAIFACVGAVLSPAFACGDDKAQEAVAQGGRSRPFMMGFSSLPRELNAESYAASIEFAAEHGEILLIQRTLPWADFVSGAGISDETAGTTSSEREAIEDTDLELFFAVDVTDGATGRDRLANLPVSLAGKTFGDPDVRSAFIAYAEYVALNYKPAYLALGVEMNLYYEKNKEDFDNFRTLYAEAYAAVKEKSPGTMVTTTFQYEDLQGLLPREDEHFPSWQLVKSFDEHVDFVGISTYPSFAFPSAAAIPGSYYTALRAFTDKPIAITEMGYASTAGAHGVNSGTEEEQEAFLRRALEEAEAMNMPFAIWLAIWDPAYARDTAFSPFQSIGLLRESDEPKLAWAVWDEFAAQPHVP
jgi:hypothetical protein